MAKYLLYHLNETQYNSATQSHILIIANWQDRRKMIQAKVQFQQKPLPGVVYMIISGIDANFRK